MATHWEDLSVDGGTMNSFVAEPGSPGKHAGIVVIMGAGGIDDTLQGLVADLADHDFTAIAPYLFHRDQSDSDGRTKAGQLVDPNIVSDVNSAIEYLQRHPSVDGERSGIVGFCLGGRVSYLMATQRPDAIRAAAVYYGGNIMVPRGDEPSPFEQTSSIQCPIIGLFGADDENPSPDDINKIGAELSRLGKHHEFHSYANAGHGFMGKSGAGYREHAANDAWPKTLNWFEKHLQGSPGAKP